MSFHLFTPDDPLWNRLYNRLPIEHQDVFYSPGFAALCQKTINSADRVLCAAWESATGGIALYPFVQRDIGRVTGLENSDGLQDLVSLYGRGGMTVAGLAEEELAAFHRCVHDWALDNRVICSFDRFHPVLRNEAVSVAGTRVIDVGGFVVVDLTDAIDLVESRYKQSMRADLGKAERSGVTVFFEESIDHLDEFLSIYYETMRRHDAKEFYFFERAFFELMPIYIPGKFLFSYARMNGDIVSAELILKHGIYAHCFLSGTKPEVRNQCPNHRLKRDLHRWLAARGCHHYLLGGGSNGDDGIFKYKRAFAPNGVLPSRVGGGVFDASAMQTLRQRMEVSGAVMNSGRFQFYDPQ